MSKVTPKFTPGPYHRRGVKVFWTKPEPDLPKDSLFNGLVAICATTEDNPPEVLEEAKANATLFVQSPTMFEFICDLVGACDYGTETLSPAFRKRAEKIIIEVYKGSDK